MPYYHRLGNVPHKRHVQFRSPEGQLYHEELMGLHGFSSSQSLLYHLRPLTQVKAVRELGSTELSLVKPLPLKHRLLNTLDIPVGGDAVEGRLPILANQDLVMSVVRPDRGRH